ncbi:MAG: arginase family protein, partial [Acidobacteriota bacterium]|nr:arginase family protein [Acidobacteriota bacterium]
MPYNQGRRPAAGRFSAAPPAGKDGRNGHEGCCHPRHRDLSGAAGGPGGHRVRSAGRWRLRREPPDRGLRERRGRDRLSLVCLLGLPTDEAASFARGAAAGPAAIRAALHSAAGGWGTEAGLDLAAEVRFADLGDLILTGGEDGRAEIERAVDDQLENGGRLICLGGDHSVAYPILAA